jgi:hypothetical protein
MIPASIYQQDLISSNGEVGSDRSTSGPRAYNDVFVLRSGSIRPLRATYERVMSTTMSVS